MKRTPLLFIVTFVFFALAIMPSAKTEVQPIPGPTLKTIAPIAFNAPLLTAPAVTLTSPGNNSSFIAGATIRLSANALDSDGTISKVEFYQGAVKLGTVTSSPYNYDWLNVPAGSYVLTAVATDNQSEVTTSTAINISVLAQVKQYVGWSAITNGTDLGNGSVRKTSTGAWDFNANGFQTLLAGDGYFESTAANFNQSIGLNGANGQGRAIVIGSGGWVGIYEGSTEVAATVGHIPSETITPHGAGDRYRIEITNSILRYIRYRGAVREIMFQSAAPLPAYPMTVSLGMSPQNAEWQKTILAQLTRKATWSSIANGIDLGDGSLRKTSTGTWDFSAVAAQTLARGDGYFESTASYWNHSINLTGSDGGGRSLLVGTGGWAAIYEGGVEVANTSPLGNITPHAAGDRYRLEISNNTLRYVRYRGGIRSVMYTSANAAPAYPITFSLGMSFQNSEWQNTVFAQLSNTVTWSNITNGIDLGNGSVRKTSTGTWDFSASARQQLVFGPGYFESTASYWNHSINLGGSDGAGRSLVVGTGGWAAVYENNVEVASTSPLGNLTPHAAGDRYRLELIAGKLRYVRYRSGARSIAFTSTNAAAANPLGFSLGMSFQNSEWQNTMFSDNVPEHNDAAFVSQTVPATMTPGQSYNVIVTMRNTGSSTWTPDGDYQLASENLPDNTRWGMSRVNLNAIVPPGSDATFSFMVTAPAAGSHSFQWRMVQQNVQRFGALTTNVNVLTVNNPPAVSLTSPAQNAIFTAPATVGFAATATDSDGTIAKVEFFQGSTKVGEDTSSPYAFNWTNVSAGTYVLSARATDNGGSTTTSSMVNITVNPPNQPPVVSLTAPTGGQIFSAPASITLTADASDTDGIVTKVQFFRGGTTLIGEDTSAPFSFNWTNVAAGNYSLTAKAFDNAGATTTSNAVAITVNALPSVSLIVPSDGQVFTAAASVTLTATASDADGSITKVQFFQGTTLLNEDTSSPYSFNWTNVGAGNYSLTAKAFDNLGGIKTSAPVAITVNALPSVNLTAPTNGQVFTAPASITLTATASDSDGSITKVQFFQGTTLLNEDTLPPYSFNWTNVAASNYSLTAKAFDNLGGTKTSAAIPITVNALPSVNLTAPANGQVFTAPASITLTATASDSDGSITKVQFFQGTTLLNEDTLSPYSFDWTNVAAANYSLTAKAFDNLGGISTSGAISITVNAPPTVSLTSPANNAVFNAGSNIVINASAADTDGTVTKVEFFRNGIPLGEDTSNPYTFVWNGVSAGNYVLTARATDNLGATSTSAPVNINVIVPTQIARLDPLNRTGGNGENPLSRNFAWGVPLVDLPGRAGLDLGITLSYNSLVWTKNTATSTITFDDDHGSPSPGFRLGFAVIQGPYFNSLTNKNAYLLITPSGDRIEFRALNTPSLFASADASYMTLQVNGDNTITVRTTDGTQLSYQQLGSDYVCTKIMDRNGNYINVNYVSGRLDTVVDTLSRTIKFNYDGGGYPTSITQVWNQGTNEVTHEWASFTYNPSLPIHTSFSGVTNLGPQNDAQLKVLSSVSINNGTARYDFAYTSWGQVWKISQFAASGDLLNYRAYNLPPDDSTAASDCPRFTERRDWAQSWNGDVDGVPATAEEVVTSFVGPANTSLPDGSLQTVTRMTVTLPDGTYHQIYYAGTSEGAAGSAPAWQRGLPLVTDTFGRSNPSSSIIRQRSVAKTWTQDDENLSYSLNPRITETYVSDFNDTGQLQNRSRTRVTYRNITFTDGRSYSFPENVYEYRPDLTTVLRRTFTDYNLTTTYTNRHIMGLVKEGSLHEVDPNTLAEKLMSKVSFEYDGPGSIQEAASPVQHDDSAYDTNLVAGRGNLSKETRYDTSPGSQAVVTASMFYNTAGLLVKTTDFANHQTLISYTDKFAADGLNLDAARPSTLAYPTMVTDGDGYVTRYRYHYDLSVLTWRKTPEPNTTALNTDDSDPGPEQIFSYDSVGRVQRITNQTNSAYTRYVYPDTQPGSLNRVDTYRTIVDGASEQNGNEAHSLQVFDGHGRLIGSASGNPGSFGGSRGQYIIYDNLGRMFKTSNATETSASGLPSQWAATGDDEQSGFLYMQQTYDWKGRPLVTTNPDSTTKVVSYAGCGCAGGEVTTITDEGTIYNLEVKRRQQKIYSDALGRAYKTQILNWDGAGPNGTDGTVYATLLNTFNARDQVTVSRIYQGTETSNVFQETVNNYDGYGRLSSQKKPEQINATTFSYYDDDSVHVITDARGATTTFTYNGRQKVLSITYGGGFSAPAVTVQYDAVGNRTHMSDGIGTVDYHYDQLSRLTSEDRFITSLNQTFTLSYGYNLADQMTTLSEPAQFGSTVINVYDKAGQITEVNGSGGGASQYASNIQYRAWGGLKHLTYGNSLNLDLTYNNSLKVTQYDLKTAGGTRVMGQQYEYFDDGRLKKSIDLVNSNLKREYGYDNAGRLLFGITTPSGPYEQTYLYDVWGNMTFRGWRTFAFNSFCNCTFPQFNTANYTYTNNKNTASGWSYDLDGRLLTSVESGSNFSYSYDAAGRALTAIQPGKTISQSYDGDGQRAKWVENGAITYYIRSSALGGRVITELNQSGGKRRSYVYAGGEQIAKQENGQVFWDHRDVSGVSMRTTNASGTVTSKTETDPLGTAVDDTANYNVNGGSNGYNFSPSGFYGNPTLPNMGCSLDGVAADCNHVQRLLNNGAAVQCPSGGCGPQAAFNPATGRNELYHFNPNAAAVGIGTLGVGRGFLPPGVNFVGNGFTVAPGAGAIFSGMGAMVDTPISSNSAFYSLNQIEILVPWSGGQGGGGQSSQPNPPQHPLKEDIAGARAKIENDKWCREALDKLLAATVPQGATIIDNQKFVNGKWTSVDMYDAFDRLSRTTVVRTGKSGEKRDGSVETINDLSVDLGGGNLYVNNNYVTRKRDEKIFALIHESLHLFAGYSDQALALAARKLDGEKNPKPYPSDAKGMHDASLALNDYIGRHCKDLSSKGTTIRVGD